MSKTGPPYPAAFGEQMVELVRSGRTPGDLAREFEASAQAIRTWVAQPDRDTRTRTDGLRTPQWTGQNQPFMDTSKPAISGGPRLELSIYFTASSVGKVVSTLVGQLRGPHLRLS